MHSTSSIREYGGSVILSGQRINMIKLITSVIDDGNDVSESCEISHGIDRMITHSGH